MNEKELNVEFENICKQYVENKNKIELFDEKVKAATKELDEQIKDLNDKRNKIYNELVTSEGEILHDRKDKLVNSIIELFPQNEKTVRFDVGRFTKKILKSVEVVDKDKLLNALVDKKMLSKGIKSFDNTFLKKSKELGLFTDEEVKVIEKASLLFVGEK